MNFFWAFDSKKTWNFVIKKKKKILYIIIQDGGPHVFPLLLDQYYWFQSHEKALYINKHGLQQLQMTK